MHIIRPILVFIEVVSSFLLIAIILIQKTKKEGLGLAFGSGMGESLFGSRAGNILTKTTVVLAVVFLANTTLLGITHGGRQRKSVVEEFAQPGPPPGTPAGAPGMAAGAWAVSSWMGFIIMSAGPP